MYMKRELGTKYLKDKQECKSITKLKRRFLQGNI